MRAPGRCLLLSLPLLVGTFLPAGAPAQAPPERLIGPAQVGRDRLARLRLDGSRKAGLWIVSPEGKADVEAAPDGKSLIFTGPAGDYDIVAVITDDQGRLQGLRARVQIREGLEPAPVPPPAPPQPPPPGPVPGPVDPVPPRPVVPEVLGFVTPVRTAAASLTDLELMRLRGVYEVTQSKAAAGAYPSYDAMMADNRERTRGETAGSDLVRYNPLFATLSRLFKDAYLAGTVTTPQQAAAAWSEVLEGLRR